MATGRLENLCRYVRPGEASACIPFRDAHDAEIALDVVLTVTMHVVCSECKHQSEAHVTVTPSEVAQAALAVGWRKLDGQTLCQQCAVQHEVNRMPAEARSQVLQPKDLAYYRGKGGNGTRGRILVTGRVVGRTEHGDELLEEFTSIDGVLQRETIARSYLDRVTTPVTAEEARKENPHLFTMVKDWVRKQMSHAIDEQARAERLSPYTFYQHRTWPEHVRATGTFIRCADGTGVAEVFHMEHRSLQRHCVSQAYLEEHFVPLPFAEALRRDRSLVEQLDRWARKHETTVTAKSA